MTHRAQQVVDAIAELVRERVESSGVHVYTHRRLSLDPEQDELPGISIDYGDLAVELKDPEEDYYDCTLDVFSTVVAVDPDEASLRDSLMAIAVETQAAISSLPLLGLNFVNDVIFSGWVSPSVDPKGGVLVGSLVSTSQIKFRMQFEDPGATGSVPNL